MKIFLIGMPGSGKTTLGKQLAADLGSTFIDLDHAIESKEQKSIPEIFSEAGEDHFREVESAMLKHWAAITGSYIIATGGGAPCFHDGIKIINESGVSIFLDVGVDVLFARTMNKRHRPLLNAASDADLKQKLVHLMEKRKPIYQSAHITLKDPTLTSLKEALQFRK